MNKKLWTPGGEVTIEDSTTKTPDTDKTGSLGEEARPGDGGPADDMSEPTEEDLREYAEHLDQLRRIPVKEVVLNQAVSLAQIASLHLSPDELDEASLAIDALIGMVDKLGDRLGPAATQLRAVIADLQMQFVATREGTSDGPQTGS